MLFCLCISLSDAPVQRQKALTELGQKGDVVLQETSLDKGKNSAHAEKQKQSPDKHKHSHTTKTHH